MPDGWNAQFPCHVCGEPSVVNINGMETCRDHLWDTVETVAEIEAMMKGAPIEDVREALRKVFEGLTDA